MLHENYDIDQHGNTLVVTLAGKLIGKNEGLRLNDSIKDDLENALSGLGIANDNNIDKVVFDVAGLEKISGTCLLPFLKANKFIKDNNIDGKVIILNPQEHVRKVLKIAKLDTIFDIQEGSKEAVIATLQSESK